LSLLVLERPAMLELCSFLEIFRIQWLTFTRASPWIAEERDMSDVNE
uniref:Transcriptional regulator n=1 Tax=Haemonchus placei TaxID=6290 RepID=A0A0N4VUH5_HAEPC